MGDYGHGDQLFVSGGSVEMASIVREAPGDPTSLQVDAA
jgi:hypothetical protein